ncbi:hypothetical protein BAUCODRAFT_444248 [Baudoinia panamericana UAMH 10762]|uniref:Uncharacterized protein n=1 Tax=Baudoinia panamericana (strain UAMH 10762) TaxID=717646 RepID=M2NE44_BAUPA|nr:uncharacterized protein BAUCODRAFT_444248 [Baudoinia panamericana UAMH 10762]EMC97215.1 hypothetical protein BAUCODRAFT_444248 [Baudoinia panamericana UAMH 10762]
MSSGWWRTEALASNFDASINRFASPKGEHRQLRYVWCVPLVSIGQQQQQQQYQQSTIDFDFNQSIHPLVGGWAEYSKYPRSLDSIPGRQAAGGKKRKLRLPFLPMLLNSLPSKAGMRRLRFALWLARTSSAEATTNSIELRSDSLSAPQRNHALDSHPPCLRKDCERVVEARYCCRQAHCRHDQGFHHTLEALHAANTSPKARYSAAQDDSADLEACAGPGEGLGSLSRGL